MTVNVDLPEVPPIVQAWIRQLTDPTFLAMMRTWPAEQVDVRLTASRGRVRRLPEIVFNGGPQEMVNP
jgi:hypothetical protein